jgi:RNA polymerase-binding transcription factor DksA
MAPDPGESKEQFEAKAKAEGWKCSRCGKAISFEDREAYLEAGRCSQCHYELDTESGTIPSL